MKTKAFAKFLEVNIQHSIRVRILFPYIAYIIRDDLCRKLETISDKGYQIIRRAEL